MTQDREELKNKYLVLTQGKAHTHLERSTETIEKLVFLLAAGIITVEQDESLKINYNASKTIEQNKILTEIIEEYFL